MESQPFLEKFPEVFETLEGYFHSIVNLGVIFMEAIGAVIIIWTAIRCIADMTGKKRDENFRIALAKGISLALEFKMGGEVLRTVLARDFVDLGIIGCLIALRAAMAILLHWEIKNEQKEEREAAELKSEQQAKALEPAAPADKKS